MTLEKLAEDKELVTGLVNAKTVDEMMATLREKQIELEDGLTPEKAFQMVQAAKQGELGEDDLENVNGGLISTAVGLGAAGALGLSGLALITLVSYGYHSGKKRGWW